MRILIFGATGATGRHLVDQALMQGHEVTAFARDPNAVSGPRARLTVARGDILDVTSVEAAMPGQQAVLCALGARKGTPSGTITVGTRHIVAAMERSGVRRLVFESAFGVADSREKAGFVFSKILLPLFFKESYEEKARQEAAIRASSLDWTIVRPVRLTDEPARGTHRVIEGSAGSSARVPFADVAGFMLAQLADNRYLQKAPGLMQ